MIGKWLYLNSRSRVVTEKLNKVRKIGRRIPSHSVNGKEMRQIREREKGKKGKKKFDSLFFLGFGKWFDFNFKF